MMVGGREVVVMAGVTVAVAVAVSVLQSQVCVVVAAVVGLGFIFAVVPSVVSSPIDLVVSVSVVSGVVNPIGVVAVAVLQLQVGVVAIVVGLGFIFAEVGSVVSSPIFKVVVVSAASGEVPTDPGNWRFFPTFWPPSACFFACFPFDFLLYFFVF